MAKAVVTIAPEAIAEALKIATWWNRNRPAAPRLFQLELDRAIATLVEQPELGRRLRAPGRGSLRALTLPRTRYVVFYEYRSDKSEVILTRIRHGHRRPLAGTTRR